MMRTVARKRLSAAVVGVALVGTLVACDSSSPDSPGGTSTSSSSSSSTTNTPASSDASTTSSSSSASSSSSNASLSVPSLKDAGFTGPVGASLTAKLDASNTSEQVKDESVKPSTYTVQVTCQGDPITVTVSEAGSIRPAAEKKFECDKPGSATHTVKSTDAFDIHRAPLVISVTSQGTAHVLVAAVEGNHVIEK